MTPNREKEKKVMTLSGLPVTFRILFTCYLLTIGIGYLLALVYLFLLDIEPHRGMGFGLVESTIVKYYGKRDESILETSIKGAMGEEISQEQQDQIIQWIHEGASQEDFDTIQPIFTDHCTTCHSREAGLSLPPLTTYAEVERYIDIDLGQSVKSLARVSHIHLFGMSFIFFLTGIIFALSEINKMFRLIVVALPFIAIWIDILSWWFTKFQPFFAYTIIIGGGLMGFALACQIFISLYEMWIKTES